MKRVRLILVCSLVSSALLIGIRTTQAAEPATPLPASRLNVEQVKQALDRNDIADAVRQVELGWKQQYEEYYRGQLTSRLLDTEAIRIRLDNLRRLTGKKTALIYAVPTPTQLELILLPSGADPVHRRVTAASREKLLEVVKSFRSQVVDTASQRSDYLKPAQQLYEWIIAPLQPDLKAQQIDTLIFCLGGGLRTAPLAALHDGKQFLIQQYSLAIIPAFNLLDHRPAVLEGTRVLAMGASQLEGQAPLPAVPLELSTIVKNLWAGDALLNQDFTMANLKAYRAKYPYGIIHLATHADFVPGSISNSYIQFWDGRLSPDRFRDLGLRMPVVQLLVLSACRTALGNLQAELGFAGLAVMSGSKAAIASIWSVSDVGTLVLMTEFYRRLQTAPIKTEALRQAQIALLSHQGNLQNTLALADQSRSSLPAALRADTKIDFSHPYYWAGFTLIGNPW